MDNWHKTNAFTYTVRATDPIEGITFDELRKRYFAIGIGEDLTEIPFIDMLVVFSMIEQEAKAIKNRPDKKAKRGEIKYQVTTDYSDEDAARLLSAIQIETPFDTGKYLRIVVEERPVDPPEDDRQM